MGRWVVRVIGILMVVILLIMLMQMQKRLVELQKAREGTSQTR